MNYTDLEGRIDLQPDKVHINQITVLDNHQSAMSVTGDLAVHNLELGGVRIYINADDFKILDNNLADVMNKNISAEEAAKRIEAGWNKVTNDVGRDTQIKIWRKGVESGLTVAQPLKESGVFPPMVVQMIGVGEQTGALDAMLSKIADFYEEEVDQAVANLLTLMEPVMILFLGVTVGGIVISMYLPLFDLISKLS